MTSTGAAMLKRYAVARTVTIIVVLSSAIVFALLPRIVGGSLVENLTLRLGSTEDAPLAFVFLLAAFLRPSALTAGVGSDGRSSFAPLYWSLALILLLGWLGHQFVFHGYALSRDEQMAVFDQNIFLHGRLMWPIPVDWRFVADALNRRFMLPIGANEYWVSGYLPIHSSFRALLATVGAAELSSPIMAAVGAAALWTIARRLWPNSGRTHLLALLLLITSSQFVITSMTDFSMSMHLALNLVWLALFLADRPRTHIAAVIVGFFATGIHQPLFHPMFILPFLLLLAQDRRWRLLGSYVAAYAVIGVFWMAWPLWITSHGTGAAIPIHCNAAMCSGSPGFIGRLLAVVTAYDLQHLWMTAAMLLRFVCWQHPLLMPLGIFGAITCWRSDPVARALAIGFVLPIAVMAIILPWQGHGWGYRYVHQVLGNAVLLACYGFRQFETNGLSIRRPLIWTTVVAVVLLPVHAWMAERIVAPFVQVHNEIASIPADAVLVDTRVVPYGDDVVFNRFDLSNRPKILIAVLVQPGQLSVLCRRGTVAFYDSRRMAPIAKMFGLPPPKGPSEWFRRLHERAGKLGCGA